MRKLLTAGIFGTILGIVGAGTANASIVSSGFLDEKLTEYALSTSLDLKANQSDLTALSNIVGTPTELTYSNILDSSGAISDLMGYDYYQTFGDITVPTNNISEFIKLNHTDQDFPGLLGIIEALFSQRSMDDMWPLRLNDIFNDYENLYYKGFYSFLDLIIDGGTLEREDVTVYGLKDLTTKVDTNTAKIGTLSTTANLLTDRNISGWGETTITLPETIAGQLELIFHNTPHFNNVSNSCQQYGFNYGNTIYSIPKITKLLDFIIAGIPIDDNRMFLDCGNWYEFRNLQVLTSDIDTINANIGTVPDGQTVAGMATTANTNANAAKSTANTANETANAAKSTAQANAVKIGTVPDGKNLAGMISETDAKIGTLPFGNFPSFSGYRPLFSALNQPDTYPTSLAELINAIYGNSESNPRGLLSGIFGGIQVGTDDNAFLIGIIPNYELAKNANDKIGTLPAGYDSVGAALTAIKGIAEDAKAAALAAIPDPKQEGSSGKFVLTVDIVGDNATYHWEKIDREGETTTTTTTE